MIELEGRFKEAGIACGRSSVTRSLEDVLRALAAAYPSVDSSTNDLYAARMQPLTAAATKEGILLLDHLTDVSNPMVRFLRRLHRGTVGMLSVVDLELEEEKRNLRPWRVGTLAVRMPPESAAGLSHILTTERREHALRPLCAEFENQLIRCAAGRPGWMHQCIELERQGHYWPSDQLFVSQPCDDTDRALHQGAIRALGKRCRGLAAIRG